MRRRDLVQAGFVLPVAAALPAVAASPAGTTPAATGTPFDGSTVRRLAQTLAQKPFQPPLAKLPPAIANLTYDQYRSIRFDPNRALWRGLKLYFQVQFFHLGFLFKDRVDIYEVAGGLAHKIVYQPDMFIFGKAPRPTQDDLGFAGFRIHAPFVHPDYYDEVCAFLGASYFRAVARGQNYGLSARGLALKTADPKGEEFPLFRSFWIQRPLPGVKSIVVYALLDSQSTTGAFRFTIRPGAETVFDVQSTLFPRVDIIEAGIAPLTSMFSWDFNNRIGVDDYRPAVHDSDSLLMETGRGEQLLRALNNPNDLQFSAFGDINPRGFGLLQRRRAFHDYQDLEAHYEQRPSCWVEPIGDWGEGAVDLVEIPSKREINDNIVAFWRPKDKLNAKGQYDITYRLHWCEHVPWTSPLAKVAATRSGLAWDRKGRLFVIDFTAGAAIKELAKGVDPTAQVHADHGTIKNVVAQPNPESGGWRISFELQPAAKLVELHAQLMDGKKPLSETWLYRWTP